MKQLFTTLLLCISIPGSGIAANLWQQVDAAQAPKNLQVMHPTSFLVYTVDEATLKLQMWDLSTDPNEATVITLPMPDGSTRDFKVWQTPMMPDQLATKYPGIRTFTATALDNHNVTAKLDFTAYGFHAMIYDGQNSSFIDPYDNYHDGYYMVHYKKNETLALSARMKCLVHTHDDNGPAGEPMDIETTKLPGLTHTANKVMNGYQLRTYRLALSADNFYCQAATGLTSPTIAQSFSAMTTSMNRINGVYEREFSITMNFVTNEDTLIWPTATGSVNGSDPFNSINSNPNSCLTQNQTECDTRIGNANYDIGHVFTTGAGGLSDLGCVCQSGYKAQSATGGPSPVGDGFNIDYVAHEMGHEYGANHPFNDDSDGSCCCDNINLPTAYEPGSGSTIMAYAGICSPDDLQYHSDAYFHAISLQEITTYSTNGGPGDACPVKTPTSNKFVSYTPFAATYSIPYLTPFELAAPVITDSVSDSTLLYCWEEWDLGTGLQFINTHAVGPIFRSYDPVTSNIRVFPKISMVLAGTLSNVGTEGAEGEKVPDVARTLNFKCTFRDMLSNTDYGCITVPDDEITLNAINTGAGFAVTSQNTAGIAYTGGSTQVITWNVVGTNASPINATTVDIYMSYDGGNTWYYPVGTYPNNGSATITVPNPATTTSVARFKVKGSGNVFFNVNSKDFTVYYNSSIAVSSGVQQVNVIAGDIKIFPVPATGILHITAGNNLLHGIVYNTVGQTIWQGEISGKTDIPVSSWATGVYYMRFADLSNGNLTVKSFIVQ